MMSDGGIFHVRKDEKGFRTLMLLFVWILMGTMTGGAAGGETTKPGIVIAKSGNEAGKNLSEAMTTKPAWESRHYQIYSTLKHELIADIAEHMDGVFEEYDRRFASFRPRERHTMKMYIFRTQKEYMDFLGSYEIDASNSSGMFFIQPQIQGLATWVEGRAPSVTYRTLQHEGFHQFVYAYFGTHLPIWLNEGLAQYFEEGILLPGGNENGIRMELGFVNPSKLLSMKLALAKDTTAGFDRLLQMTDEEWAQVLRSNQQKSALLYDQAWSVVHFLIHADNGRYRDAFERMLTLLSRGKDAQNAFEKAFGTQDIEAFRRRWMEFIQELKPDAISMAVQRMELLGQAMLYLKENKQRMPETLEELRKKLRKMRFRAERTRNGVATRFAAEDNSFYEYPRPGGGTLKFDFVSPQQANWPPGLSAPSLKPCPVLVWYEDEKGKLATDVVFRP